MLKRTKTVCCKDITGREIVTEGLCTVPLWLFSGNHRSYEEEDHAVKVLKTCSDYDCLIPAWYLEKHQASRTTTSHLYFPNCGLQCFGHGKLHPEYSVTYDRRVALNKDAIHIGSLVQSTPYMLDHLPKKCHKFLL